MIPTVKLSYPPLRHKRYLVVTKAILIFITTEVFTFQPALGPQWNHSIDKPSAKGVRFGGKVNTGFFVANGFALFGSVWGNFLEAASLIAGGSWCQLFIRFYQYRSRL
jgi:hypothetical protein